MSKIVQIFVNNISAHKIYNPTLTPHITPSAAVIASNFKEHRVCRKLICLTQSFAILMLVANWIETSENTVLLVHEVLTN